MTTDHLEGFVQSLSIALMNGLWQGGILVLVYIGVARWVPWMSASARHNLGMMTLIAMVWIHCAHIFHPLLNSAPDAMAVEVTEETAPVPQVDYAVAGPGALLPRTVVVDHSEISDVYPSGFADPALIAGIDGHGHSEATGRRIPHGSRLSTWWVSRIGELKSMSRQIQWNMRIPFVVHVMIVVSAIVLAFCRSLLFLLQLRHVIRIKKSALSADPVVESFFQSLLSDHPRRRSVSLGVSAQVSSPLVIGFRHPKILLPPALNDEAASIPALRCILHHELAHIERWDEWSNLLQQCLVSLTYFNPTLTWLSTRLTIEREMACDERAVTKVQSPQDYALVLTEFAMKSNSQPNLAAPAAWNKKSQLKERITMIINGRITTSPWLSRMTTLAVPILALVTAAIVFVAGPRWTLAQAQTPTDPILPEVLPSPGHLPPGGISPGFLSSSREIQSNASAELVALEHLLAQKNSQLAGMLTRYSKKHPSVVQLVAEITSLEASIQQMQAHLSVEKFPPGGAAPHDPLSTRTVESVSPSASLSQSAPGSLEARLERLEALISQLANKGSSTSMERSLPTGGALAPGTIADQNNFHPNDPSSGFTPNDITNPTGIDPGLQMKMNQEAERRALEAQRQALEAQKRALDQQIQALNQELQKMRDPFQNLPNNSGIQPENKFVRMGKIKIYDRKNAIVNTTLEFDLNQNLRLSDALAKVSSSFRNPEWVDTTKVRLIRPDSENGGSEVMEYNWLKALTSSNNSENPILRDGDRIQVKERGTGF